MITDGQNTYSASQALSGAGSAASTNSIDHSSDRDVGIGEPMCVSFIVNVAAGGTAPTLVASLQVDSTSAFGSAVNVVSTGTIAGASLVPGYRFFLVVPSDLSFNQHSRINYTLGGTSPTVTLSATLVPRQFAQGDVYGPSGFSVQ